MGQNVFLKLGITIMRQDGIDAVHRRISQSIRTAA